MSQLTVSVPDADFAERLGVTAGVDFVPWDLVAPAPASTIDLVVVPYLTAPSVLESLRDVDVTAVQSQSIGYDGVAEVLPRGVVYCNAAGVHEASTAELAIALILASERGLPDFVLAQRDGRWDNRKYSGIIDKKVLLIGNGGVGRAIEVRLRASDVVLERVATTARSDENGVVHGIDELADLLPAADIVVLAVPLTARTTGLVDAGFLARMKPGALLVNVARGPVVDTDALVSALAAGQVRAALDVTDPEPLPAGHPLWTAPGVLISPHVGGHSGAMAPRIERLVRAQIGHLQRGEPLENVVLGQDS